MVKRQDDLQEREDDVKSEILGDFIEYYKDNPDYLTDDFDGYYQGQGSDHAAEFVDSSTPIYYKNIDDLYYLYGDEFDEAFENAGVGRASEQENYKQVACYFYLSDVAFDYLEDLRSQYDDWYLSVDDDMPESIAEDDDKANAFRLKSFLEEFEG